VSAAVGHRALARIAGAGVLIHKPGTGKSLSVDNWLSAGRRGSAGRLQIRKNGRLLGISLPFRLAARLPVGA
jgi:hypothetical protein